MLKRVRHDISSIFFFVSQNRKTLQGNPSLVCFTKLPVAKKFLEKRGGGVSRFSVEKVLAHSAEKIRRLTPQCVTDFGYRKSLCFRRFCHDFPSEFFLSRSTEKSCRGTLLCCVSEKFP